MRIPSDLGEPEQPAAAPLAVSDRVLESIRVGEQVTLTRTFTEEDVRWFAEISGDGNPLHLDREHAAKTRYGRCIVHGQLVAAPISALAGCAVPGKRCLLLEVRSRFLQPVFPGDRLTYKGTVTQISGATRAVRVQVEVVNQDRRCVLRGSYEAIAL